MPKLCPNIHYLNHSTERCSAQAGASGDGARVWCVAHLLHQIRLSEMFGPVHPAPSTDAPAARFGDAFIGLTYACLPLTHPWRAGPTDSGSVRPFTCRRALTARTSFDHTYARHKSFSHPGAPAAPLALCPSHAVVVNSGQLKRNLCRLLHKSGHARLRCGAASPRVPRLPTGQKWDADRGRAAGIRMHLARARRLACWGRQ